MMDLLGREQVSEREREERYKKPVDLTCMHVE